MIVQAVIIERIGEHGKGLCPSNFTRWKDGGYKDWLLEQTWLADTRAKQESASDVAGNFDGLPRSITLPFSSAPFTSSRPSGDVAPKKQSNTARMMLSNDPRIWRLLNY